MIKNVLRIRINHHGKVALGPGKVELLQHIEQSGSISAAAKAMKMSYRRAWELVDAMNQSFDIPVVQSNIGGSHGGGASVTEFGKTLIDTYLLICRNAETASQTELAKLIQHLKSN